MHLFAFASKTSEWLFIVLPKNFSKRNEKVPFLDVRSYAWNKKQPTDYADPTFHHRDHHSRNLHNLAAFLHCCWVSAHFIMSVNWMRSPSRACVKNDVDIRACAILAADLAQWVRRCPYDPRVWHMCALLPICPSLLRCLIKGRKKKPKNKSLKKKVDHPTIQ